MYLNQLGSSERKKIVKRIEGLIGVVTAPEIAKIVSDEFPNATISATTVRKLSSRKGLGKGRGARPGAKRAKAKAKTVSEREQELAKMMRQGAKFVRDRVLLPPIPEHIQAIRLEDMGFDTPQEAVALFSDLHYYSKIDRRASNGMAEYNIDIARARLIDYRDGILRFTQMGQVLLTIDTLHIFALGDELEGHGQMFQSQALQMSESITFQLMGFVEDMSEIILSLLQRFKKISIVKVPGNHGRTAARARGSYTPDNFELMAWEMIAERVRHQTGGDWRISENGCRHLEGGAVDFHIVYGAIGFVDILGSLCLLRHGHGIKGLQATYTGAIDNKLRLNSVIGEVLNYYFKAHLHEAQSAEHEIRGEIIQNGSFVGPSLLSIEMSRASANLPSQEFMLFHPRRGKTQHNRIHLASVDEIRQIEVIGRGD